MLSRDLYCTILCQTFSPCGRYLIAGNTYGQIAVYDLKRTFEASAETSSPNKDVNDAECIFEIVKDNNVCSLATAESCLIVGVYGEIIGYDWKFLKDSKPPKSLWKIRIPDDGQSVDRPDVNSLWWKEDELRLLAGCGDNNIYAFDVSKGKLVRTYEGHADYVHSIQGIDHNMVSASEDGSVKLWDDRTSKSSSEIVPHLDQNLARPDLGKWIGSASLSNDWIICGGGPKLALWQLRTSQVASAFNLPDHGIHVSYFHDDRLIAAGAAPHLYQLNYTGEITAEIPVSATTVYSAVQQTSPYYVFTIAGSSPDIDLCTNFNYKDRELHFRV